MGCNVQCIAWHTLMKWVVLNVNNVEYTALILQCLDFSLYQKVLSGISFYSKQCTLYIVQGIAYRVYCTVCSLLLTVNSVQSIVSC